MSRISTRWLAALATLVVFVLLAWLLGRVLTLTDGERLALRVGLVVLGLVAAGALLWYLRPRDAAALAAADRDDALTAVAAARARLPRGAFDARPLVLVLGSEGSCKTTVVMRSGMDPELLAGDATPDAPPPTAAANLWLVRDAVLAEAGGPVFADEARWRKLVRALRAPRIAAALGRGTAAPRAAVVCVSCDLFYAGGAGAQLDSLAQVTRERLAVAAREFGVALPVYVLFTKADRVPHFETWAAPFTRDEAHAAVGAALPFDAATTSTGADSRGAGTYAERIVPRLEHAFAGVVSSLAGRRIDLLGRESVAERRLDAYELPRELGKLAPALTRFLAEICRPMQLGLSPQLRGFYLIGARPVVVADAAPSPASAQAPVARASGATSVFAQPRVASAEAPGAHRGPATRRVPQWVFLDRIFPEVVLADAGAAAMGRGGMRVARLRRALLGVGIAAALFISVGVLRSWIGNRSLADRTTVAARGVAALPVVAAPGGVVAFPSAEALRRLDALRGVLDTLRGYSATGVPMRLRWGLWRGDALVSGARKVWLNGYHKQLHATAWGALVDSLRALPDAPRPNDDYGHDYSMLKAYLITTAEPTRSTPEFLAPVLLTSWARGQAIDADISALARRQFEYYATELARENPWPVAAEAGVVSHTRGFLGQFSGGEQIYQYMLAQANKAAPGAKLAELAPQASGVITAPAEVPGAFTAAGWSYMADAFRNSDRFFEGERWVLGDAGSVATQDRDKVLAELRKRYRDDYVQQWRAFTQATSVVRPSGARDAAQKLGILGGAQSPLLAVLSLVSRNTAVDSSITAAFQPVHEVVPAAATDKYVSDGNQPYVNGLVTLQGALEQVTNMPPAVDTGSANALAQAGQQALGQVTLAKVAARQLAQKFAVDTAAVQVGRTVAVLLEAPINGAEGVLRGVAATRPPSGRRAAVVAAAPAGGGAAPAAPAGGGNAALAAILNERGRAICADMTPMLSKFPFNPDASAEATVAEVGGLLAPGTGSLFAFQQERLDGLLEKQGDKWVAKPGAGVQLSQPFVAFFNRAAQVSNALYDGGAQPHVILHALGEVSPKVPQVNLFYGSQVALFKNNTPPAQLVWPNPTGRDVKLTGQFGRKEKTVAQARGEWALFRLVAQAARVQGSGGTLRAEWNAPDRGEPPVAVEFTFANGAPVLQRGWLGGMSCTAQVTR